jgi:error-prone DNA polymerase
MERLRVRLYAGMAERGITGAIADEIFDKMAAFANYGFPESHSVSFAYLVYASAWIKYHEPAAFCAALLNAQPMGFWSSHSLVQDARRHGVVVHGVDINASRAVATLEPYPRSHNSTAIRLGIGSVRGIGTDLADAVEAGRPYGDLSDLVRRIPGWNTARLEALAMAGAFESFGMTRREAIWSAGAAAQGTADRLPGIVTGTQAPQLPGMDDRDVAAADLWATGVAPDGHPTQFVREDLRRRGVVTAVELQSLPPRSTVLIGGVVTHRQRPMTAQGTTFMNIEDETGLVNVVISKGCWARFRALARGSPALLIRGRLERSEGVVNVVAQHLEPLPLAAAPPSRDFR